MHYLGLFQIVRGVDELVEVAHRLSRILKSKSFEHFRWVVLLQVLNLRLPLHIEPAEGLTARKPRNHGEPVDHDCYDNYIKNHPLKYVSSS